MKTPSYMFGKPLKTLSLLSVLCFILFSNMKCKKDSLSPTEQLPPATQTGANTFGCLVNGQPFKPTARYIYNNNLNWSYSTAVGGLFSISATNEDNSNYLSNIRIEVAGLVITENRTYVLTDYNVTGKGSGSYSLSYSSGQPTVNYRTNNQVTGMLTITKYDQNKHIVSGIFAFDVINSKGDILHVTDGRFDLK